MRSRVMTGIRQFSRQGLLTLAALLALPTAASSFSLGEIQVRSQLGELFHAEIPLRLHPDEEAKGVEAAVADVDSYHVLQLPRDLAVTQLQVHLEGKGANRRVVLESDTPLRAPFFNLLLKTSVGVGSHYRNYPVFLTVPGTSPATDRPSPRQGVSNRYGPVRSGESLTTIARKLYPGGPFSQAQVLAALWLANQHLPDFNNMNRLPTGITLTVPTEEEMGRISPVEASALLEQQRQGAEKASVAPQKKEMPAKAVAPVSSRSPAEKAAPSPQAGQTPKEEGTAQLLAENQRLTDSVNKALSQVELLSNKVAEAERRLLQNEQELIALKNQLREAQDRWQVVEQRVTSFSVVAPVAVAAASSSPPPRPAEPPASSLPWLESVRLESVGLPLAGLLVGLLVWLRRKKPAPPDAEPAPMEPPAERQPEEPPAVEQRLVPPPLPTRPPLEMEDTPVLAPILLKPVEKKREEEPVRVFPEAVAVPFSGSPFQEEEGESGLLSSLAGVEPGREEGEPLAPSWSPPSPVAEMAEGIGEEIVLEDGDEESIFKAFLETPATAAPTLPVVGVVGQSGEEVLEMFEFSPVKADGRLGKAEEKPPAATPKPADEKPGGEVLEWVVDDQSV